MNYISRNLSISMAAGNATIWKPSPTTPLCSIAVTRIVSSVLEKNNIPGAVAGLVTGGKDVGEALVQSQDVDMGASCLSLDARTVLTLVTVPSLVSFTGSENVGRAVGKIVQSRFGKVLLELGGNNGTLRCISSFTRSYRQYHTHTQPRS
jgi:aldehyde dehydrogenase family 7 protein A1